MVQNLKVEIALFGAFRKFETGQPLIVELPQDATLCDLRQALGAELSRRDPAFNQQALLDQSALADDHQILHNDWRLEQNTRLAILPPVSGG